MRGSWRHLGSILGGLRPSWERLGGVLGPLGVVLGHLGGVLGALWAPNPNKSEGDLFLEPILGSVWGGLGASWALLKVPWRVFLPLLERLGRVLTTNWKKTRFLQSRKRFFNLFDAFETLKFDVSPRREPYFSKKYVFVLFSYFVLFWPVLGALLASFWRSWGGLGGILGHLGPGQGRSSKVRSSQVRSSPVKMALRPSREWERGQVWAGRGSPVI